MVAEPLGLSQDHQEPVEAGVSAKEAGGGDRQDGLGDHRLDHQIDQAVTLALAEPDDFAISIEETGIQMSDQCQTLLRDIL